VNAVSRALGIRLPLVQAPMAGVSSTALAAAVSTAGGLGSIAIGALGPEAADAAVEAALRSAGGPINVNVFVHPKPPRNAGREAAWLRRLAPLFEECGATAPAGLDEIYRPFDDEPAMLDVLLARRPAVVSFHFGIPCSSAIGALKRAGTCLMATATSVAEARALEEAGIDLIVAQGYEAGGHRGAFLGPDEHLATLDLVPRIRTAVALPIVAAGGITRGRDIAAAMAVGAEGSQLGSAFIDCPESTASGSHRQALRDGAPTRMTALFSGRPARGIVNRFVTQLEGAEDAVPPYPLAYDAAKRLAAAAAAAGRGDGYAAWWAGSGRIHHHGLPAAQLVSELVRELEAALATDRGSA
jgi:nitronate monooxygenase